MTTPGRRRTSLTERLRSIAGRSRRRSHDDTRRSHVREATFDRSMNAVWTPPDPPRRWFERQGVEKWRP